MSQKRNKDLIIIGLSWIIVSIPVLILLCPQVNEMIQAEAIITLVFVTWFYAKQTQKQAKFAKNLLDEQKLKKDLEFNERRLHSFYNPYIYHLDELKRKYWANEKYKGSRIRRINYDLEKPHTEIFYNYSYMVSEKTIELISFFIVELGFCSTKEANKELKEDDESKLFELWNKFREKLHEERTKIEDYISANYPFPEKEIKNKEVNHGSL